MAVDNYCGVTRFKEPMGSCRLRRTLKTAVRPGSVALGNNGDYLIRNLLPPPPHIVQLCYGLLPHYSPAEKKNTPVLEHINKKGGCQYAVEMRDRAGQSPTKVVGKPSEPRL